MKPPVLEGGRVCMLALAFCEGAEAVGGLKPGGAADDWFALPPRAVNVDVLG